MPEPTIIVLASRIGAGKSTLASALQGFTGFPVVSFGRYVKSIAAERNMPLNRETLQDLGEEMVSEDPVTFTGCALAGIDFSKGAIVDGLRHNSVLEAIRSIAGQVPISLVFLRTEDNVRSRRLLARGMSLDEIKRADLHKMEKSLDEQLLPIANLVVDGASSPATNAQAIIDLIASSCLSGHAP